LFVSYFESYNADTYNTTRRQSTATVSPVHIARPPPLPSTSYVKHFQKIKILPRPNTRHTPTACHPLKDEWPDRGSMSWNKKKTRNFFSSLGFFFDFSAEPENVTWPRVLTFAHATHHACYDEVVEFRYCVTRDGAHKGKKKLTIQFGLLLLCKVEISKKKNVSV
jgi:hypothetical protein